VINYDMPDTADAYIHRIGRTGRAKRTGEAFTLITPDDYALVQKIEKIMKQKLPQRTLPDFDYDVPMPEYPQTVRNRKPRVNGKSHSRQKQRAHQR
jgi:ATP-dependent RNA helicase RhlE